jgi:hypothetical protein
MSDLCQQDLHLCPSSPHAFDGLRTRARRFGKRASTRFFNSEIIPHWVRQINSAGREAKVLGESRSLTRCSPRGLDIQRRALPTVVPASARDLLTTQAFCHSTGLRYNENRAFGLSWGITNTRGSWDITDQQGRAWTFEIDAIRHDRIRITDHADEEARADQLSCDEIFFSVLHGEIIEDYPTAKPYPSCLIYGDSSIGEPIHSVWAYNPETKWAVLITVYRPDPERWINWRKRRRK